MTRGQHHDEWVAVAPEWSGGDGAGDAGRGMRRWRQEVHRHRVHVYDIPSLARGGNFLDNKVGHVIANGWQVSGITTFQGGFPDAISPRLQALPVRPAQHY